MLATITWMQGAKAYNDLSTPSQLDENGQRAGCNYSELPYILGKRRWRIKTGSLYDVVRENNHGAKG